MMLGTRFFSLKNAYTDFAKNVGLQSWEVCFGVNMTLCRFLLFSLITVMSIRKIENNLKSFRHFVFVLQLK